ncbi:MAG: carbohydrate kinase family protein [Hyphomicrobiaceae bacterium]
MKAVTVGGAMVDSIAIIEDERIERMSMRNAQSSFLLLEDGQKIEASEISQHCGGGAVNTAVCMARLGIDTSTVVKLGQDQRADVILRRLEDEAISTRWVMRDHRSATGAAVVVSSHERDAAIFTFRGANTLLEPREFKPEMFAVDLVYVSGLSNESADCFPEIIRLAKTNGAKVATNPGIRQITSRTASFLDAMRDIHILSLNRTEAAALVPFLVGKFGEIPEPPLHGEHGQRPDLLRLGLSFGGHDMSLPTFALAIQRCGVPLVLVTNGSDGAYVGSPGQIDHCAASSVGVVGTAGAGDAFASTFAAWMCESNDKSAALRAATCNAASVIAHADTQTGLLARSTLEKHITSLDQSPQIRTWSVHAR